MSFYSKDYYVCIMGEHIILTSNPNPHFTNSKDIDDINKRYLYEEGQKILTPFGIETIKEIIRDYSTQHGYEWLIMVEENGNQYKPCELNGIVVRELPLEIWEQITN